MTYTLTQQLSHEELWESWDPTRTEDENGCHLLAFTPMGLASLRTMGEERTWIVEVGWSFRKFSASSEEKAIYAAVASYRRTERAVVKAYVLGLQVNLGEADVNGSVETPTTTYSIRKWVESPPGGETRTIYTLKGEGRILEENEDFHVWEETISWDLRDHLLNSMNLTEGI